MAAKGYDFFSGSQEDINRRLLRKILALEAKVGSEDLDIGALETAVGDDNSGLIKDVADLKTAVGSSSGGLVKAVGDLETAVGDADSGLVKGVADINTEIGTDDTPATIKGRIYALEDHTSSQEEQGSG